MGCQLQVESLYKLHPTILHVFPCWSYDSPFLPLRIDQSDKQWKKSKKGYRLLHMFGKSSFLSLGIFFHSWLEKKDRKKYLSRCAYRCFQYKENGRISADGKYIKAK